MTRGGDCLSTASGAGKTLPDTEPDLIRIVPAMCLAAILAASGLVSPAAAEVLWNDSGSALVLRDGPGLGYLPVETLEAGLAVERGPCDETGTWCVVSTDTLYGWIDTRTLEPPLGLEPPSAISVTPLPGRPVAAPPSAVPLAGSPGPGPVPEWSVPDARPPRILSTTEPLGNVTDGLVNLRAGPDATAPVIGQLLPGEGGLIDVCDRGGGWCRISPPGARPGWVSIRLIGLRRL